jgi:hypothetical protein
MTGTVQPELRAALERADDPRAELARRVKKAVKTMRENVDGETVYAEPPGGFDTFEAIVQERDAEGGIFVQTAGIHRADVLMAFLELAEAEAGALWGEYDGPPEVEEEIREARQDTETASWQARRARQEATRGQ